MKIKTFDLLKPKANVCQKCAVDHHAGEPHDKDSLYYQLWFKKRYKRWPTWQDAIAHCDEKLRAVWKKELKKRGVWT